MKSDGMCTSGALRSSFARASLCLLGASLPPLSAQETDAPPPPAIEHVLLVSLDTTRRDHLGFHGGAARTPQLDALARAGSVFESAFAPTPITLPSHATLFTGLYPPGHGVRDNALFRLGPEAQTLAERLRAAGFRTGAVVSAFVLDAQFGLDQGFESYDDRFQRQFGGMLGHEQRSATETTDAALRWLDARGEGRFFLFVHYFDAHHPYEAPEAFAQEGVHPYDAELAYVDAELGRLLEALRARELLERTLVIVTADHGESLGEHGEKTHGVFVYQSTQAVPLVFHGPSIAGERRIAGNVSLADVAPTILELLELLELPREGATHGRSLAAALRSGAAIEERPIYLESWLGRFSFGWAPLAALVTAGEKFVSAPDPELYDLRADPAEAHDLLGDEPERAAAWQARLDSFVAELERMRAAAEPRALSDEERARLESLGYVSSDADAPPGGRDPKLGIAELALLERAGQAQESGDFEAALRAYDEILAQNPANRVAIERSGLALVAAGRPEPAIARLEQLGDALFPGLPTFQLASAHAQLGHIERALELIDRIRKQNPKFSPAHLFFAQYHEALGETEKAIEAYETLLANWHGAPAFRAKIEARIAELRKSSR